MKPIVLVNSDARTIDMYDVSVAAVPYLAAVRDGAGAVPLQLPALAGLDPADYLGAVAGVLLTGSRSNVHPARYGEPVNPESEPFDTVRDAINLPLIQAVLREGLPLLAICRGFQELNIALGGTLHAAVHALPDRIDHRYPDDVDDLDAKFRLAHEVEAVPGGQIAAIVGRSRFMVNSLHRQGVDRLSDRLVVEARADDGTIEAVSVAGAAGFALGVQWHPEYWATSDPPSRAIFEAFGDAVRARAGRGERSAPRLDLIS